MPSIYVLVPLAGAFATPVLSKFFKGLGLWLACLTSAFVTFGSLYQTLYVADIDSPSAVMLFLMGLISMLFALYSSGEKIRKEDKYYTLIQLALAGMAGVSLAADVFSMYIYIEVVAASSFVLMSWDLGVKSIEASVKYLIVSAAATSIILVAVALTLLHQGTLAFGSFHSPGSQSATVFALCCSLFVAGFALKSGLMPFHMWVPDAYSGAYRPVSILLGGVITKASGLFALVRLTITMFRIDAGVWSGIQISLLAIGALSVILGAVQALVQTDMRRMLAYSSISQMGYIAMGIGTGTPLGMVGAVFHIFNHGIFKGLLYMNAGSVEKATGTGDLESLGGLGERMPVTGITGCLGFLSAAGIPPLSGFWSKLVIILALWQGGFKWYAGLAILGSVLTLGYFLTLQRKVFFGKLREGLDSTVEVGPRLYIPSIILGIVVVFGGLLFSPFLRAFAIPVGDLVGKVGGGLW